jgi:hypothetical protein
MHLLTDRAARRRVYVLLIFGIAVIAIAVLLIFNGKPSNFSWEYQACVAWREVGCPHIPQGLCCVHTPGAAQCQGLFAECTQTHMRLFPWVYTWLVESGFIAGLAFAAVFRILKRK